MNDILNLIALVVAAAGVAFIGRRVLGVPVGWPRSIIVGMIMISSLSPILPLVEESVGVSENSTATPDILLTATGGPQLSPTIGLYAIFGYCLLFVGCVLALRALILIFRRSWSL